MKSKIRTSRRKAASPQGSFFSNMNGSGQSLPKAHVQFFKSRMNHDFSGVRIHTGEEAEHSASALHAHAYTWNNNIVFNKNKYQPETHQGKKLLAHELTHIIQQTQADPLIQRQAAPHFRDCVRSVTGRDDADQILNRAMHRAREYITTALDRLLNPPVPGSAYEEALQTHFGNPINDARRLRIRRTFERILPNLVVPNFICNRNVCDAADQASWHSDDDLIHVCPSFWRIGDINCQAIILIHEAAHDAGVDAGDPAAVVEEPHTPNRGEPNYPVPGQRRVGRISRSLRMNTPDAYAFFAAHVHNSVDTPTDCFH